MMEMKGSTSFKAYRATRLIIIDLHIFARNDAGHARIGKSRRPFIASKCDPSHLFCLQNL
jgi:hypothetical protein